MKQTAFAVKCESIKLCIDHIIAQSQYYVKRIS